MKTGSDAAGAAPAVVPPRQALRARLLAERAAFVASPSCAPARDALTGFLCQALVQLAPACLGLYWPFASEFNAAPALGADAALAKVPLALPYARRSPRSLEFRRWDGGPPLHRDECGIGTGAGAPVTPDVVVVPCVGFTRAGHRLGYGGGYYDRWLADHPEVVAVGVAWSFAELDLPTFAAQPHDVPLALVLSEHGAA